MASSSIHSHHPALETAHRHGNPTTYFSRLRRVAARTASQPSRLTRQTITWTRCARKAASLIVGSPSIATLLASTRHPNRVAPAPHHVSGWLASQPCTHTIARPGLLAIHTTKTLCGCVRTTLKAGARVRPARVAQAQPTNEIHKVFP